MAAAAAAAAAAAKTAAEKEFKAIYQQAKNRCQAMCREHQSSLTLMTARADLSNQFIFAAIDDDVLQQAHCKVRYTVVSDDYFRQKLADILDDSKAFAAMLEDKDRSLFIPVLYLVLSRRARAALQRVRPGAGGEFAIKGMIARDNFKTGCSATECPNRDKPPERLVCSACRSAVYCSSQCQRQHWPAHRALCRENAAALLAGTTGKFDLSSMNFYD